MNKFRRTGAVVALSLTLAVSAFAGIIHSPGKEEPTPPPPNEEQLPTSTTTTTEIATTIILTIISSLP